MEDIELLRRACKAREQSYCPYSHFAVGAALLAEDGQVFEGCNIENAGFSSTVCAERTAFFKAVSQGVTKFKAIAIVGGAHGQKVSEICPPCGVCRQVMREFCDPQSFEIVLGTCEDDLKVLKLEELFPYSFGPDALEGSKE